MGSGSSGLRSPLFISALHTHTFARRQTHTPWRVWSRVSITDKTLRGSHVHRVWWTRGRVKSEFNIDNSKSALRRQNKTNVLVFTEFMNISLPPPRALLSEVLWQLMVEFPHTHGPQGGTALAPRVHYCPRNTSPFGSIPPFLSLSFYRSPGVSLPCALSFFAAVGMNN